MKKTAMLVEVIRINRGNYHPTVVATGTVQAAKDIVLSPQVGGEDARQRADAQRGDEDQRVEDVREGAHHAEDPAVDEVGREVRRRDARGEERFEDVAMRQERGGDVGRRQGASGRPGDP